MPGGALALLHPGLQHVPVERTWGGIAPQTGDGLPVISAVPGLPGLFVGSGLAYGATVGPGAARVLADLVLERESEIDIEPFRYARPAITEGLARSITLG